MIFLRHPAPDIARGICYGRTDMGIAEIGHEQIRQALVHTPPFERIIASPALRCRQLAEQLAERQNVELTFDERLWEMDMGDWEGKAWKDIDRTASEAWLKDTHNNSTPNGESFRQVQARVHSCIDEILDHGRHEHHEIAIVCHASPIRATWMRWNNLTFREAFSENPDYATPIIIEPPL